jgi:Flp pilus assembly pilin Flp
MITPKQLCEFHDDDSGASTVEWAVLLVAVGLPSFYLFSVILNAIAELYRMVTFTSTLPLP